MNGVKEVEFRNYDDATGFFYDDTVEAFVWDNDLALCSGYWVVDTTVTIGDSTGQDPEESHQVVFGGDVKLIVEDGVSLTIRWDDSWKLDAAEITSAVGDTVSDITSIVVDAIDGNYTDIATDSASLISGITDVASKIIEDNEGTKIAMFSVCEGASLTVYGQENGTGKLDIQAPSKSSGSNEGGAAIGGDSKCSNGAITINGAQVIATSRFQGAAIGGGAKATGHNITINGGYVNAQNTDDKGAGIGGGHTGTADNITINGGYVYAYGYDYGAGIGAGTDRDATNITINGGYIYAESRSGAAAIGGGWGTNNSTCGYFTINNGYVRAKGGNVSGQHSPAIGRGAFSGEDITQEELLTQVKIYGGHVYCTVEADNSEVIGKGYFSNGKKSGLYFKGVYLNTGYTKDDQSGYLGYQNGSIDYFTNDDYKDFIEKGVWVDAYATQGEDVTAGFSGDKTSSAGYYADTINGGFYHVTEGYYFANTASASIKGLNNNGYYIKGGAIFNEGGYLDLYSVTISNNKSRSNGSAVQNGSALGGAIYANGGTSGYTVVSYSKFENNVTTGSTGDFRGGAIASEQDILTVTGSVFNSNKTTSKGGAIWANGTNVIIDDSEFGSNYASYGGAIYAEGIQTIIKDTFTGNLAGISGGAVFAATGSTVTINNSDFDTNRAHAYNYDLNTDADQKDVGTHRGGAVYVDGDKEQAKGATVYISASDFTENYAKQGGALYVAAYGNATVTNVNFIKNEAGTGGEGGAIYVEDKGTLTLNDVYFSGNRSTVYDEDGNVLTEYCAIYNEGEINFTGEVTVDPYWLDKMVNRGWINWDLTGSQSNGYFSDMTLFINDIDEKDPGYFGLTVNADDLGGISRYVLGKNANFEEMPESLTRFVLRGVEGLENQTISLNGDSMEYNGKVYTLTSSDKAEDYYEIVLTVTDKAGTPERTGHIVVNKENYNKGTLTAAGNFENFDFGETEGGIVLVESDGTFQVHDSTFTANKAVKGGAIYAKAGGQISLTNVTFNGNLSDDGQSGAMYIEKGAAATMYGNVTLVSTTDTIYNEGELIWNIGLTTQGYVSDFSRIVNEGTLVVECNVDTQYGQYLIAGSAKTAAGQVFTVRDANGYDMEITVGGASVVNGDYAWRLYVDSDQKYALCLSIDVSRIVVKEGENYTLGEDYSIDMSTAGSYDGNGQIIEVQKGGSLTTAGSAKIVGCSATDNGGAIWNRGTITLDNARLFSNEADSGNGGAIYNSDNAKLTISNSTLRGNTARKGSGGAIADDAAGTITVTNTTFAGNSATNGGAISIANGTLNLGGVIFNGNKASGNGGAISVSGTGSVNLYGNVMLEKDTDTIDLGASGKLTFNLSTEDGSGYLSDFSKVTGVVNNTITINVNDSDSTSALYVLADNASALDNVTCFITVPTSTAGLRETKEITVNTKAVSCGDHYYSLKVNDENQLVLQSLKRLVVIDGEDCIIANDIDTNLKGALPYAESGMLIEVQTGGILENTGSLKFANCSVEKAGGVIYNAGTTILNNAEFTGNMSNVSKDSYIGGGAIASTGDLTISNSTFSNNVVRGTLGSNGEGGAIYQSGGTISISDTEFINNRSEFVGGAIYASNTKLTLSGTVTFEGNSAESDDGGNAIRMFQSTLTIAGDVYLNGNDQTIRIDDNSGPYSTIEWIVGRSANGYLSDFSKISTCASKSIYQFSIDASTLVKWEQDGEDEQGQPVYVMTEGPALGRSYLLADNAANATSFGNFILKYASSTYGVIATEELTLNKAFKDEATNVWYSLTLNSDNELALSTINHIVVTVDEIARPDGVYTMEKGDNYNWAGMDTWVGNGAIFEVKDDGKLENQFGATVQNGYATSNGGAVYNEGKLNLKGTIFSGNNAEGGGGAIFNMGKAVLKGVTFKGNNAEGCGGAIYNDEDATLSIGEAIFNGNTAAADGGGAIYNLGVLNITGSIMLMTANDSIVSAGESAVINWALNDTVALTRNTDFSISDFAKVSGDGAYTITLNENSASQMSGMFKLASNAANGITVDVSNMSGLGRTTMEVASVCRLVSQISTDKKVYYELLMDENNDLYFTVDKALFLNDSWGDDETGIEVTFHGNTITGYTGDGTFFNKSKDAEKQALTTNSTVVVCGLDHSTVMNLQGKYTLEGSVELSSEHAWVNAGTAVRDAIVNWDLSGKDAEDGICINGFQYYHNAPVTIDEEEQYLVRQTVTVTDDQAKGRYVLAAGDLSDAATDETGKYDFTLVSMYDKTGTDLALNQVTEYNTRYYSFYVDDAGTADETDDELVLNVDTDAKITIKVDNTSVMYDGGNHKASYTVIGGNLLLSGDKLEVTLSDTEGLTNAGSIETITVESYKVMRGSEDVTGEYQFNDSIDGSLEVYKRDITITTGSATKRYDGTALTCGDYEVTGSGFADGQGATYEVTGSQTEIGSSYNTITCTLDKNTDVNNYDISFVYGELTVLPASAITITANSASRMYDGTALTESGCWISKGKLADGDELVVTVEGTITDAGTSDNVVTSYQILRNGEDVTATYNVSTVNGTLEVTKRDVTLTSASDSKMYDGTPLTNSTVTVSGSGWVEGEGAVYSVTGTQTKAGSSANAFTYTLNENTKAANYEVTMEEGTLEVTPNDTLITITANSNSKMYDGTALTDTGYTVTGDLVAGDTIVDVVVSGSATHVSDSVTGNNTVTSYKIVNAQGEDVTNCYSNVQTAAGTLSITARDVTLTSDSASKTYDGTALTKHSYTVSGDGFVSGDGVTLNYTGSQTDVGRSDNTFTYTVNDGTQETDYEITAKYGVLTVYGLRLTISGTTVEDKSYDGTVTATVHAGTLSGVQEGDEVYLVAEGNFITADTGAHKSVTVNYTLTGRDSAKYSTIVSESFNAAITKRQVILTSASDSKKYDGTPLTNDTVTVSGQGWAEGEGASYDVTGSQTNVGSSANTFTYTLNEGTKASNYLVVQENGTLTVKAAALPADLDGNGFADIVMANDNGYSGAWLVQENQSVAWGDLSRLNEGSEIFGTGFTSCKTTADVYIRNTENVIGAWVLDEQGKVSRYETIGVFDADTQVLGLGDFNADGQSDLLLRNTAGAVGCFCTGGEKVGWNYFQSLGDEWTVSAIGDLNGDGIADTVLRHDAGYTGTWLTQKDGSVRWADLDTLNEGIEIVGCGDFNGDGIDDVLLKNGDYYGAWIVEDGSVAGWKGIGSTTGTVEQIADFNNDGIADLRIRTENGDLGTQLVMGEDNLQWQYYGSVGSEWSTSLAAL